MIRAIAVNNPTFSGTEFRQEFEGMMDRKPTPAEITFFLGEQKNARAHMINPIVSIPVSNPTYSSSSSSSSDITYPPDTPRTEVASFLSIPAEPPTYPVPPSYLQQTSLHTSPVASTITAPLQSPPPLHSPIDMPLTFLASPVHGFKISSSPKGPVCTFNDEGSYTAFLDTRIAEGIFHWKTMIRYAKGILFKKTSYFRIGIAPPELLDRLFRSKLGAFCGSCCYEFYRFDDGGMTMGLYNGRSSSEVVNHDTAPDGAEIGIEVDLSEGTLAFFVNGKKVRPAFSGVHGPLYFGISSSDNASFTSLSFRRLPLPTRSSVECFYKTLRSVSEETKDDE